MLLAMPRINCDVCCLRLYLIEIISSQESALRFFKPAPQHNPRYAKASLLSTSPTWKCKQAKLKWFTGTENNINRNEMNRFVNCNMAQLVRNRVIIGEQLTKFEEHRDRFGALFAADYNELLAGTGQSHVDTAFVSEQLGVLFKTFCPGQRPNDHSFLASLIRIDRVHLKPSDIKVGIDCGSTSRVSFFSKSRTCSTCFRYADITPISLGFTPF